MLKKSISTDFYVRINDICTSITEYLLEVQDFTPGEYYGAFYSEKAYHGPLLDWNAGGAHHHRGCGSAALCLWLLGQENNDQSLLRRAETAFDWLVARQSPRGGWHEIQNNEKPSDWEMTGLDELSTISTSFVVHGLTLALLQGLPPKKSYLDSLKQAGYWLLSIEYPLGSGIFPHHERSPYDTLNANTHAGESLALIYKTLKEIFSVRINIFRAGASRAFNHTLQFQTENGLFPYRAADGITLNYTSLVLWCMLNTWENLSHDDLPGMPDIDEFTAATDKGTEFLRSCIDGAGSVIWNGNETSSAKHNIWTYAITANVLFRIGGEKNAVCAERLLCRLMTMRTDSGLLPMRDTGPEITRCAFMQADILMFLLPFLTAN
jgi:hypothetical protein